MLDIAAANTRAISPCSNFIPEDWLALACHCRHAPFLVCYPLHSIAVQLPPDCGAANPKGQCTEWCEGAGLSRSDLGALLKGPGLLTAFTLDSVPHAIGAAAMEASS